MGPSSLLREEVYPVCSEPLIPPERGGLPSVQWALYPSWERRFTQCVVGPSSLLKEEAYTYCAVGPSSLWEQRSLLSWSIARRGVCAHITVACRKLVLKSASCNLHRKQEVTAKQKLCIKNKGELKNPVVYIVFSRRRKESSVGEETTWSGRLFQTGIVQGKKENL